MDTRHRQPEFTPSATQPPGASPGANRSDGPRLPAWLTFLAGMVTAFALFAGVGLGVMNTREQAFAAPDSGGGTGPERPLARPGVAAEVTGPAIAGRVVEVNPGARQFLVRNRAGRFVIVNVNEATVFRRGKQKITPAEAVPLMQRNTPVLIIGRRDGDQMVAQIVTLAPPGAPSLPAPLPDPAAQPTRPARPGVVVPSPGANPARPNRPGAPTVEATPTPQ